MTTAAQRHESFLRLVELMNENDGILRAEDTVEDGKNPESPLHREFNWDDESAGHQHRLRQARDLITSFRVHIRSTTKQITSDPIFFMRAPNLPGNQQGYLSIVHLAKDPDLARQVMVAEFARIGALLERARVQAQALGLEDELEDLVNRVARIRSLVAEAPRQQQ